MFPVTQGSDAQASADEADGGPSGGPSSPRRTGPGPLVLILPLLTLILAVLWSRHWRQTSSGERPEPPAAAQEREVEGWVGSGELAPGLLLSARLVPLHDEAQRQSFDREVLAQRLGLGPGEPWRLVLELVAPAAGAADETSLELTAAAVEDSAGARLEPVLADRPSAVQGEVVDPLRALLALPGQSLHAGQAVTLVLWGAAPGAGARLLGFGEPIDLQARRVRVDVLPATLARLERAEHGR